jgi:hypothetical protein
MRGMTTNGVLIDAEWVDLFKRHGVQITLSIDGPKNVRDKAAWISAVMARSTKPSLRSVYCAAWGLARAC